MAHLVENMFSVREKPWHYEMTKDVTKILQDAPNSVEAIKQAGLDWTVESKPIYDVNHIEIPGFKANTRSSDNSVLGVVTDKYKIVQNIDAFNFTDSIVENNEMKYETAGSLRNGKQIWLLGQMPKTTILGDEVEPYICFSNTFDGTGAIKICMTPIRVVCNNTLNMALESATRTWSTKHMGDMESKLQEARETLGLAEKYMDKLKERADELAVKKVTDAEVEKFLNDIFPVDEDNDSERKIKNIQEMKDAFYVCYAMPDLANFKGTAWGVVNAMADLVGHVKPNRVTSTYEENNWGRIMAGHPLFDAMVQRVG